MVWAEFVEIVEWMLPRWADMAKWADQETTALYDDLQGYSAPLVQRAVEIIWNRGDSRFAPRGGDIRRTLDGMGVIRPLTPKQPCEHRWTHATPRYASLAVPEGLGEQTCLLCLTIQPCKCDDCRSDPTYKERE